VFCRDVQGYGDLHAYNVAEAMFVVLYMFVSIGVAAYFVGTSVLLVQENERKTGAYRYSMALHVAWGTACTTRPTDKVVVFIACKLTVSTFESFFTCVVYAHIHGSTAWLTVQCPVGRQLCPLPSP
jgi:hypothetical protein